MNDTDQALKAFLLGEPRGVDEPFTQQVRQFVLFEQRLRAARRLAWRRFAAEVLASAGVIAVLYLLTRLPLASGDMPRVPFGPAAIGLVIVGIWTAVAIRPETHSG